MHVHTYINDPHLVYYIYSLRYALSAHTVQPVVYTKYVVAVHLKYYFIYKPFLTAVVRACTENAVYIS